MEDNTSEENYKRHESGSRKTAGRRQGNDAGKVSNTKTKSARKMEMNVHLKLWGGGGGGGGVGAGWKITEVPLLHTQNTHTIDN